MRCLDFLGGLAAQALQHPGVSRENFDPQYIRSGAAARVRSFGAACSILSPVFSVSVTVVVTRRCYLHDALAHGRSYSEHILFLFHLDRGSEAAAIQRFPNEGRHQHLSGQVGPF